MRSVRVLHVALLACATAVAVLALTGCAARMGTRGTATKDAGVVLEYRMSDGAPLSYTFSSSSIQTMQLQGQSIPIESAETLSFSVIPKGMKNGEHALGITIDGLTVEVSSPQGDVDVDTESVVGERFDMTLSKLGVEGGLPDPETLQYVVGGEGPRSILTGFGVIFPDLPGEPIEVGDTWPTELEMKEQTGSGDVAITINAVNTLEGFEVFEGLDCARISAVLTGSITGNGTQQGTHWTMESEMVGSGTWYFAHKKGILVSDLTEGTADGAITIDAPDGQTVIPVTREYTMITKLAQ